MTRKEKRRLNRERWRAQQAKRRKKRNSRDYSKFKSRRSRTYGPVRFSDQPTWVRALGRKGKARRRKASRKSARATRRSRRASSRRSSRSMSRRSSRAMSRRSRSAGKVLTYSQLMSQLRGTKLKAWVCAGLRRTGCGGGRKGRRGSRQIGVLRP